MGWDWIGLDHLRELNINSVFIALIYNDIEDDSLIAGFNYFNN